MGEYIERKAICKNCKNINICTKDDKCPVIKTVAADVAPVVHGEWVLGTVEAGYFTPGGNRPWICSECGEIVSLRLDKPSNKYCPNCGADMREVDDEG